MNTYATLAVSALLAITSQAQELMEARCCDRNASGERGRFYFRQNGDGDLTLSSGAKNLKESHLYSYRLIDVGVEDCYTATVENSMDLGQQWRTEADGGLRVRRWVQDDLDFELDDIMGRGIALFDENDQIAICCNTEPVPDRNA